MRVQHGSTRRDLSSEEGGPIRRATRSSWLCARHQAGLLGYQHPATLRAVVKRFIVFHVTTVRLSAAGVGELRSARHPLRAIGTA